MKMSGITGTRSTVTKSKPVNGTTSGGVTGKSTATNPSHSTNGIHPKPSTASNKPSSINTTNHMASKTTKNIKSKSNQTSNGHTSSSSQQSSTTSSSSSSPLSATTIIQQATAYELENKWSECDQLYMNASITNIQPLDQIIHAYTLFKQRWHQHQNNTSIHRESSATPVHTTNSKPQQYPHNRSVTSIHYSHQVLDHIPLPAVVIPIQRDYKIAYNEKMLTVDVIDHTAAAAAANASNQSKRVEELSFEECRYRHHRERYYPKTSTNTNQPMELIKPHTSTLLTHKHTHQLPTIVHNENDEMGAQRTLPRHHQVTVPVPTSSLKKNPKNASILIHTPHSIKRTKLTSSIHLPSPTVNTKYALDAVNDMFCDTSQSNTATPSSNVIQHRSSAYDVHGIESNCRMSHMNQRNQELADTMNQSRHDLSSTPSSFNKTPHAMNPSPVAFTVYEDENITRNVATATGLQKSTTAQKSTYPGVEDQENIPPDTDVSSIPVFGSTTVTHTARIPSFSVYVDEDLTSNQMSHQHMPPATTASSSSSAASAALHSTHTTIRNSVSSLHHNVGDKTHEMLLLAQQLITPYNYNVVTNGNSQSDDDMNVNAAENQEHLGGVIGSKRGGIHTATTAAGKDDPMRVDLHHQFQSDTDVVLAPIMETSQESEHSHSSHTQHIHIQRISTAATHVPAENDTAGTENETAPTTSDEHPCVDPYDPQHRLYVITELKIDQESEVQQCINDQLDVTGILNGSEGDIEVGTQLMHIESLLYNAMEQGTDHIQPSLLYVQDVDNQTDLLLSLYHISSPSFLWSFYISKAISSRLQDSSMFQLYTSVYIYKNSIAMFHSYSDYGTLQSCIDAHHSNGGQSMDDTLILYYSIEMLRCVAHLHACQIIHCNLKSTDFQVLNSDTPLGSSGDAGVSGSVSDEWNDWLPQRTPAWSSRGLLLGNFQTCVDRSVFPENTQFIIPTPPSSDDNNTTMMNGWQQQTGMSWSIEADLYSICNIIHMMIHAGEKLQLAQDASTGRLCAIHPLKDTWQHDVFTPIFDKLLNVRTDALQQQAPIDSATLLCQCQQELETILLSDENRRKQVKTLLCKQSILLVKHRNRK